MKKYTSTLTSGINNLPKEVKIFSVIGIAVIMIFPVSIEIIKAKTVPTLPTPQENHQIVQTKYWQNFLYNNPNYFDGWMELATLEAKIGELDSAHYAAMRALEINPNSSQAKILVDSLGEKLNN